MAVTLFPSLRFVIGNGAIYMKKHLKVDWLLVHGRRERDRGSNSAIY
jgi:hypothetical protein